MLSIQPLPDPEEGGLLNLAHVFASVFTTEGEDFFKHKWRCRHTRRRIYVPTSRKPSDLPRCLVVENLESARNRARAQGKRYVYTVDDTHVTLLGTVTYICTAAIMEHPAHFTCQVLRENASGVREWWTHNDLEGGGQIVRNPGGEFQPSDWLAALVFARV